MASLQTVTINPNGGQIELLDPYGNVVAGPTGSSVTFYYDHGKWYKNNDIYSTGVWFIRLYRRGHKPAYVPGDLKSTTDDGWHLYLLSHTWSSVWTIGWSGERIAFLDRTNLANDLLGGAGYVMLDTDGQLKSDDGTLLAETTIEFGGDTIAAWGPIDVPSKECCIFTGFWSESGSVGDYYNPGFAGTRYITPSGYILSALVSALQALSAGSDMTIYSGVDKVSEALTLDGNGATLAGWPKIYNSLAQRGYWYAPGLNIHGNPGWWCEGVGIDEVPVPGRVVGNMAFFFGGYWYGDKKYIDGDGTLCSDLTDISDFTARTAKATWINTKRLDIDLHGGEGGDGALHYADGMYGAVKDGRLAQVGSSGSPAISLPTRTGYTFAGYTAAEDPSSSVVVDANGQPSASYVPAAAATIHAQWTRFAYRISFVGADDAPPDLYVKASGGGLYRDAECTEAVAEDDALFDDVPTKSGATFVGVFAADDSASARYATVAGLATAAFAALSVADDTTVYCVFDQMRTVTFDDAGGTGGPRRMWYLDHALYADDLGATEAAWPLATLPVRECHVFAGYFDGTGATQYVTGAGAKAAALESLLSDGMAADLDIYAKWIRATWRVALDDAGGAGGAGAIYSTTDAPGWTSDDLGAASIASVPVPSRTGHDFVGYFLGGTCYINGTGSAIRSFPPGTLSADETLTAHWTPKTYTLSFSTGATSVTVAYGSSVGTLPSAPTPVPGRQFVGWGIHGMPITAATVWDWDGDREAAPIWRRTDAQTLHEVVDWFKIASDALVPIGSDDGRNRPHVVCRHYGRPNGASFTAAKTWLNPTVRYMVVGDVTLDVVLGRAFAATETETGYMITEVGVETVPGAFPVVVVAAVANEGADAINLFAARIRVKGRTRPLNFEVETRSFSYPRTPFTDQSFQSVRSCRLSLRCDPVVVAMNGTPCASDVVNGFVEASADAISPGGEAAVQVNTLWGWKDMGTDVSGAGGAFRGARTVARVELEANA